MSDIYDWHWTDGPIKRVSHTAPLPFSFKHGWGYMFVLRPGRNAFWEVHERHGEWKGSYYYLYHK